VDRSLRGTRCSGDDRGTARGLRDLADRDRRAAADQEMTAADEKVEHAADKLQALADRAAAEQGLRHKLAQPLADDANFVRKLKPSLIKARAKGELPKDAPPGDGATAPAGPQLGARPKPKRNGGGRSPFAVLGIAFGAGMFLAKWIDWRGHAHPRG
jgi:hypothetical protein